MGHNHSDPAHPPDPVAFPVFIQEPPVQQPPSPPSELLQQRSIQLHKCQFCPILLVAHHHRIPTLIQTLLVIGIEEPKTTTSRVQTQNFQILTVAAPHHNDLIKLSNFSYLYSNFVCFFLHSLLNCNG
jgi:hypothetical protein